eukprot:366444-Chlamydomonas_euryale.AAC.35
MKEANISRGPFADDRCPCMPDFSLTAGHVHNLPTKNDSKHRWSLDCADAIAAFDHACMHACMQVVPQVLADQNLRAGE